MAEVTRKDLEKLRDQQGGRRGWTDEELVLIDDCIEIGVYASTTFKNGLFPGRSFEAINNMMQRRRRLHGQEKTAKAQTDSSK